MSGVDSLGETPVLGVLCGRQHDLEKYKMAEREAITRYFHLGYPNEVIREFTI